MRKQDLAEKLAKQSGVTRAAAADDLDQLVHDILKGLRRGEPVPLPGLGTFVPGPPPTFRFDKRPRGCR